MVNEISAIYKSNFYNEKLFNNVIMLKGIKKL